MKSLVTTIFSFYFPGKYEKWRGGAGLSGIYHEKPVFSEKDHGRLRQKGVVTIL